MNEIFENKKNLLPLVVTLSFFLILIILYFGFNLSPQKQQATAINGITPLDPTAQTGIYVAGDWDTAIPPYVLANPDISGVRLRLTWGSLEPTKGGYDFSLLNNEIAKAYAAGKSFSIAIATGSKESRAPAWLFAQPTNVKTIALIDGSHQGQGNINRTQYTFAIPWDLKYKARVMNLIAALKNNLESLPASQYDIVTQISTFGLSQKTDEMRLPDQDMSTDPNISAGPDDYTRAIAKWNALSIPFRPSVVMSTYKDILDTMMSSFPNKTIGSSFISFKSGFPTIDESGAKVSKANMIDLANEMVIYGKNTYGKRYSSMTASLTPVGGVSNITTDHVGSISIGYQLNNSEFGDPLCLTNNTICDDTSLRAAFTNAKNAKAYFVEIFPNDVLAYPQAIKDFKHAFKSNLALFSPILAERHTSSSVTLDWAGSSSNAGVAAYEVYRNNVKIATLPNAVLSYNDSSISSGDSYVYYVQAVDRAGKKSIKSNDIAVVNSNTPPSAPVLSVTHPNATAILSWTPSVDDFGVAGYEIYKDDVLLTTLPSTIFTYTDAGLDSGSYSYFVIAKDTSGQSSQASASVIVTISIVINVPTSVTISVPNKNNLQGTVTLSAKIVGSNSIKRVKFYRGTAPDLVLIGTSSKPSSPNLYESLWDTLSVTNGLKKITAKVYDTNGGVATSATVFVTVNN